TVIILATVAFVGLAIGLNMRGIRRGLIRLVDKPYQPPTVDSAGEASREASGVELQHVISGLGEPTDIQFVPGRPELALVLEKGGTARAVVVPEAGKGVVDAEQA